MIHWLQTERRPINYASCQKNWQIEKDAEEKQKQLLTV